MRDAKRGGGAGHAPVKCEKCSAQAARDGDVDSVRCSQGDARLSNECRRVGDVVGRDRHTVAQTSDQISTSR